MFGFVTPAQIIRATLAFGGLLGLVSAAVVTPDFASTVLFPDRSFRPEHFVLLANIRLVAVAAGIVLLLVSALMPTLLGRSRYESLAATHLTKFGIFLAPFFVIAVALALKSALGTNQAYMDALAEDAPVENVTSFAYLSASAFGVAVTVGFLRTGERLLGCLYALLSLGLIFVGLEEISWGQRILGLESGEWVREHNVQDEITLHNVAPVQQVLHSLYIAVGLYGALGRFAAARVTHPRLQRIASYITPPWFLTSYFAPVAAFYIVLDYTSRWRFFVGRDQELFELVLSIGFLFFVLDVFYKPRTPRPA